MAVKSDEVIYLDHNATTPVAPEVLAAMLPCLTRGIWEPVQPARHWSQGL